VTSKRQLHSALHLPDIMAGKSESLCRKVPWPIETKTFRCPTIVNFAIFYGYLTRRIVQSASSEYFCLQGTERKDKCQIKSSLCRLRITYRSGHEAPCPLNWQNWCAVRESNPRLILGRNPC
jgi:hypothetical protein